MILLSNNFYTNYIVLLYSLDVFASISYLVQACISGQMPTKSVLSEIKLFTNSQS